MTVYIISENGQFQSSFAGSDDLVELNTVHIPTYLKVNISPNDLSDYWDFNQQRWIPIGEPPSPQHTFDYDLKQWVDLRTLEEIKAQKWQEIKQQRNLLEFGGFKYNSHIFDSDLISQQRIHAAVALGENINWKTQDNQYVYLTHEEMKQLQQVLAQHITYCHERAELARQQINMSNTIKEVEMVQL